MLRKLREILVIIITLFFSIESMPVLADDTTSVSLIVNGDGYATILVNGTEQKVSEGEILNLDVPSGVELTMNMVANSGTLKEVLFNEVKPADLVLSESTQTLEYKYTVPLEGVKIKVSFSDKESEGVTTEEDFKEEGTNLPKEGVIEREDIEQNVDESSLNLSSINTLATGDNISVTKVTHVTCPVPNSLELANEIFSLSNGKVGLCVENRNSNPYSGISSVNYYEIDNANLRKISYYGYGGPGNILTQYGDGAAAITSESLSYQYSGTCVCLLGYYYQDRFDNFIKPKMNDMLSRPDPIQYGYKVYIVEFSGTATSWLGETRPYQKLLFGELTPKGKLQIHKSSFKPELTDGNNYYSLEGAKYGVYSDSSATMQVSTLTIGSDGYSEVIDLNSGTYYVKEISAPKGYALDSTIYSVKVNAGAKTVGNYQDYPTSDPINILLRKVDSSSGTNKPLGDGTLEGAQYEFKFYKGEYPEGVNPVTVGAKETKSWVFKADKDGIILFDESYKVLGDSFYTTSKGIPTLPGGTLVIKETKAPNGYKLDTNTYIRRIVPGTGGTEDVHSYNDPTSKEEVVKLSLVKKQVNSEVLIKNATFIHTKPNGVEETVTTDDKGSIELVGLTNGTHKLKEVDVTDGLKVNENEFVFNVKPDGVIEVVTNNLSTLGFEYEDQGMGNGNLVVYDEVSDYEIKIVKVNNKDKLLDGAEFTLYSDKECTKELQKQVTENGVLSFKGLKDRTNYYFKETKAPVGYSIPLDEEGNAHVYEVYVESTPTEGVFNFTVDGVKYSTTSLEGDVHLEGTQSNRVISINIVNDVGVTLPNAGSKAMIPLVIVGIVLMVVALTRNKNRKR